jgi:hypothetical protein
MSKTPTAPTPPPLIIARDPTSFHLLVDVPQFASNFGCGTALMAAAVMFFGCRLTSLRSRSLSFFSPFSARCLVRQRAQHCRSCRLPPKGDFARL